MWAKSRRRPTEYGFPRLHTKLELCTPLVAHTPPAPCTPTNQPTTHVRMHFCTPGVSHTQPPRCTTVVAHAQTAACAHPFSQGPLSLGARSRFRPADCQGLFRPLRAVRQPHSAGWGSHTTTDCPNTPTEGGLLSCCHASATLAAESTPRARSTT